QNNGLYTQCRSDEVEHVIGMGLAGVATLPPRMREITRFDSSTRSEVAGEPSAIAVDSVEEANRSFVCVPHGWKPRLLIENCDPDRTVGRLRDILAEAGGLYDRGLPVRLAFDQIPRGVVAQIITPDALVLLAHAVCRPYVLKTKGGDTWEANAR